MPTKLGTLYGIHLPRFAKTFVFLCTYESVTWNGYSAKLNFSCAIGDNEFSVEIPLENLHDYRIEKVEEDETDSI